MLELPPARTKLHATTCFSKMIACTNTNLFNSILLHMTYGAGQISSTREHLAATSCYLRTMQMNHRIRITFCMRVFWAHTTQMLFILDLGCRTTSPVASTSCGFDGMRSSIQSCQDGTILCLILFTSLPSTILNPLALLIQKMSYKVVTSFRRFQKAKGMTAGLMYHQRQGQQRL